MSNDSQTSANQNSISIKDFIIPISIVLAGLFIGLGLYFSGSSSAGTVPVTGTQKEDPLVALALEAGVDKQEFLSCLDNEETLTLVEEDEQDAIETGGRGTPWGILVGPTGKKYQVNGALPQASLEQLIALAMADTEPEAVEGQELLDNMKPVSADDHIKGNVDAKVKIVIYTDYDCPFCTRMHATMNQVIKNYDPGDFAWVYRHFPLDQLHPNARRVAMASECVAKLGEKNDFWTFTDGYMK
jgi:protein-disulfide isomerase